MATQLQQTSKFELVPLSPAIGVEARGLDITKPLDGETRQLLRQAWAENSILLVRTDGLTEDEQFAYARNFGDIADRVQPPVEKRSFRADPTNRMQLVTDEVDEEGKPKGSLGHSEMWFHTDKCYIEKPHRASFLYAVDIPPRLWQEQ